MREVRVRITSGKRTSGQGYRDRAYPVRASSNVCKTPVEVLRNMLVVPESGS
jgi:hypothetical protein